MFEAPAPTQASKASAVRGGTSDAVRGGTSDAVRGGTSTQFGVAPPPQFRDGTSTAVRGGTSHSLPESPSHRGYTLPVKRVRTFAVSVLMLALLGCGSPAKTSASPGHTPSPSPSNTPFSTNKMAWSDCSSGFQCGSLTVPLDYSTPGGKTIALAVIRMPARDQAHRIGSVVINPGGPGGSGLDFLRSASSLFNALNQRFDLVSFDPRGVGKSAPIRCLSPKEMEAFISVNPAPQTQTQIDDAIRAAKNMATECEIKNPDTWALVGTVNAAHDMDRLRDALGDAKLTYIGFSYGSLLGDTYADMFPTKVRAMSLDGALDPGLSADDISRDQAIGFEKNLDAFLADCGAHVTCAFYNAGKPLAALDGFLASVTAHPLPAGGTRTVGIGEAYMGILAGMYLPSDWPILAFALHSAQAGKPQALLALADQYAERQPDGSYSNVLESNTAINCDDGPAPGPVAHLQQLAVSLAQVAPHFGPSSAWGPLTCDFWPVLATGRHALSAAGAPTIVVVGATNDPATPYKWAQGMARELKNSVLLTRTGDGHVSYNQSACIRTFVNAYLDDPAHVPPAGTVCASDPG